MAFKVPEQFRLRNCGTYSTDARHGNNGAFQVHTLRFPKTVFNVIASDGGGWEHVSVSLMGARRCPAWDEMCFIKSLFWGPDDCVIQFHPPESEYVNHHPYCLHLWRKSGTNAETPPACYVGPQ
jgi:hypothetical protein